MKVHCHACSRLSGVEDDAQFCQFCGKPYRPFLVKYSDGQQYEKTIKDLKQAEAKALSEIEKLRSRLSWVFLITMYVLSHLTKGDVQLGKILLMSWLLVMMLLYLGDESFGLLKPLIGKFKLRKMGVSNMIVYDKLT